MSGFGRAAFVLASLLMAAAVGCGEDTPAGAGSPARPPAPAGQREASAGPEPPSDVEDRGEPTRLGIPARLIHRARREAAGLDRLPASLRRQILADRRAEGAPSYVELRADAEAHAGEAVGLQGRVELVRPAGARLWIMALKTRPEADRWVDPLYVLSVVDPELPPDGGARAYVHGWIAGERTIGRNALPLIVAYAVEPVR